VHVDEGDPIEKTLQLEFTNPNVIEQQIYSIVKPPQTSDCVHLKVIYSIIHYVHAYERYSKVHNQICTGRMLII